MLLTDTEIERITEKKRPSDQCSALRMLGIAFGVTLSGRPVVTQSAVESWAGGKKKELLGTLRA
jgi:hypothetical protein